MTNTPGRDSAKVVGTVLDDRAAWLVEQAQRGDSAALNQLVSEHLQLVYNIVGRALAGHADTDDVVQETLLQVVRGLGGLRDPARFRSWTVAIAMNQVRRRRRGEVPTQELADCYPLGDPGADFAELTIVRLGLSDQRREVVEATRWLDQDDRELLALWWLEAAGEISRGDLATALELSPQHAAVRVQRMKAQLETARVVVRALRNSASCPMLSVLASDWDGMPSALWRKRIGRHARECEACSRQRQGLVPAEGLLAGLVMVPLPPTYGPGGPPTGPLVDLGRTGTPASQGSAARPPRPASSGRRTAHAPVSHRAGGRRHKQQPRGHRRARSPWRRLVVATGVAAAVTAGAAGVLSLEHSPTHLQAAVGSLPARVTTATTTGSRSTPAAAPTATAAASPTAAPSSAPPTTARPRSSAPASTAAAPAATAQAPSQSSTSSASTSANADANSPADQVLALINQARAAQGLAPLTLTSGLDASAAQHNATMADGCGLSHQCPGEPAIGQRETDQGVQWSAAGENIGDGGPVADDSWPRRRWRSGSPSPCSTRSRRTTATGPTS